MLAIFNTIGQLVDGLCDSKRLITEVGSYRGAHLRDLLRRFAPLYSQVYRRKGSVHRIDVGAACGGSELFCIQCVVSLDPAGRRNVVFDLL